MREIDLIPGDYREHLWKLHVFKIFCVIILGILLLTGTTYAALVYVKQGTQSEIEHLSKIKDNVSKQRDELEIIRKELNELDHQWSILSGLRISIAAEDLFVAIDRAIQDVDVWFTNMSFKRAELNVSDRNDVNTGYFIIISPKDESNVLAIGAELIIAGETTNYSTLSSFVNNLIDQEEILNAKVLETSQINNLDANNAKFRIAITINLEDKKADEKST